MGFFRDGSGPRRKEVEGLEMLLQLRGKVVLDRQPDGQRRSGLQARPTCSLACQGVQPRPRGWRGRPGPLSRLI